MNHPNLSERLMELPMREEIVVDSPDALGDVIRRQRKAQHITQHNSPIWRTSPLSS